MAYNKLIALSEKNNLILGSGSPRRVSLLKEIGVRFKQMVPDVHEIFNSGEKPYRFAERIAREKAVNIMESLKTPSIVISCDTIVVLDNNILGKPINEKQAYDFLKSLSGKEHIVCTAVAIAETINDILSSYELTRVFFNDVTDKEISDYIATGEPLDKAGAYGIQGMGAFLVDRIDGSLDNVIGLPRLTLARLADKLYNKLNG